MTYALLAASPLICKRITSHQETHMLKVNVGLSRKVGEPNYGSRGASVNLELEVESGLASEPDSLRDRVRQLFRMARSAVDEELSAASPGTESGQVNSQPGAPNGSNGYRNGSGAHCSGRSATQSQVRAIYAIANRQGVNLAAELQSRFGVSRPEDLGIREASSFIDAIKPEASGAGGGSGGRR